MEGTGKLEPEDFMSNMPDNVVTNIMDRLPIQDAVRTGILARNWRFKWTLLTQLVFDQDFYEYLPDKDDMGRIVSRLLLHLKGAITKFVLYIHDDPNSKLVADFSHWILFLSRNGIKDLTLEKGCLTPLKLPTHLFSCLELKHLKLVYCYFDPPATFHGFPTLLSLELDMVPFESRKYPEFFTQCPVLEILKMHYPFMMVRLGYPEVKLIEIAKLVNLKVLSIFPLCNLDNTIPSSSFELMNFLPKLQELDLDFSDRTLTEDVAEKWFPTTFPCLKTLNLSTIDLGIGIDLSYAFQMIRSFPNLRTLKITSTDSNADRAHGICSQEVDCNAMGLLQQLRSVVFTNFEALENEACLVKYILASSPSLEKLVIRPHSRVVPAEQLMFAGKLLKLQRAYPVVDIDYEF